MGCCVKKPYESNNEIENIFRDIIASFARFTYASFRDSVDKIKLNVTDENINFSEDKYKKFVTASVDQSSEYKDFHSKMVPDWDNAWSLCYKEHLEANIFTWGLAHMKETDKFEVIKHIMKSMDYFLGYKNFMEFLNNYLKINLEFTSSMILKKIYELNKTKNSFVSGKMVNLELVGDMEKLFLELSNTDHLNHFKKDIDTKLKEIFKKQSGGVLDGPFTKEIFNEFNLEFSFLWDAMDLRAHYFERLNNGPSMA